MTKLETRISKEAPINIGACASARFATDERIDFGPDFIVQKLKRRERRAPSANHEVNSSCSIFGISSGFWFRISDFSPGGAS